MIICCQSPPQRRLPIETLMEKVKRIVIEKHQFEYSDLSKLTAAFAVSEYGRMEQNRLFFFEKSSGSELSIEPCYKKSCWQFWLVEFENQICRYSLHPSRFRPVSIPTQRKLDFMKIPPQVNFPLRSKVKPCSSGGK